jgi:hypothetical protein
MLHNLPKLESIDTSTLVEVARLKKRYEKKLTLIDEEIEIVRKYGRKTNELINYMLYREEHETINRHIVSQKGQVEG